MATSDLGRRLGVAAVGIPAALAMLYFGRWPTSITLALLTVIGSLEVYRLGAARGWRAFPILGSISAGALVLMAGWLELPEVWALPALGVLTATTLLAMGGSVFFRGPGGDPLLSVAVTLLGPLWVGLPLAFAVFLRLFPGLDAPPFGFDGAYLLMLPIVVTWIGDSAAYFTGRSLGRRKLLPSVSPAKTIEGGLGGLAGSVAAAVGFAWLFLPAGGPVHLPLWGAAFLGGCLSVAAQVGDLAESVFKREAGVKDSGTLLPGHGGVLDRFDALLFTIPLTWLLLPFLLTS